MNINQSEEIKRLKEKLHFAETNEAMPTLSSTKSGQKQLSLQKYKTRRGPITKTKKGYAETRQITFNIDTSQNIKWRFLL